MTTNNRIVSAAIAASALLSLHAGATVMQAASFDEKVDHADAIILGHCNGTRSQWDPTGRWILTYADFQVEQSMKGQPASTVTIVTPGGAVGGIHQSTIGMPEFHSGDERVLFVRNSKVGPTVLFAEQGAYEVYQDERGERGVRPVATSAVILDTQRGIAVPLEQPRSLRAFQGQLQQSMAHSAARMEMVKKSTRPAPDAWKALADNRWLVLLALIGAAIATWRIVKR